MAVLPFVKVEGDPYAVGHQIGQTFAAPIAGLTERKHQALSATSAAGNRAAQHAVDLLTAACNRHAPHLLEEMRGYADGAAVPLSDVLLFNCGDEVSNLLRHSDDDDGCTAVVVGPARTGGRVLAGQSKDGPSFQAESFVALRQRVSDRPAVLQLAYPGMLGLCGLSEIGTAVHGNEIHDCVGAADGLPVVVLKRLMWECATLDEVENWIARFGAAAAANFTVACADGSAACFEVRGSQYARIDMTDDLLTHSNHFISRDLQGREDESRIAAHRSRQRLERIQSIVSAFNSDVSVRDLYTCFADRQGSPAAIWAEPTPHDDYRTNAVVIADLTALELHIRLNPIGDQFTASFDRPK